MVASDYKFIVHKLCGLVFTVHETYKHEQVVCSSDELSAVCLGNSEEKASVSIFCNATSVCLISGFVSYHKIHFMEVYFDTDKGNMDIPCFKFL